MERVALCGKPIVASLSLTEAMLDVVVEKCSIIWGNGSVLPALVIRRVPNARARHVRLIFGWSSADLRLIS